MKNKPVPLYLPSVMRTLPIFFPPSLECYQSALPYEPKSYITRDLALLQLFKLRGKTLPKGIAAFFKAAGADVSNTTGPLRGLEDRVAEVTQLCAIAYITSGRD